MTRFLALLIDHVVGAALWSIPTVGGFLSVGYFGVRDGLSIDVMDGRSLGKHLMGLQVERLDRYDMDVETSFRRNWMWCLGMGGTSIIDIPVLGFLLSLLVGTIALFVCLYEGYRVLTRSDGRRWGDDLAQTRVVEA